MKAALDGTHVLPIQVTCVGQANAVKPPSFGFGAGLQLLQSVLLIFTFFWALKERQRYRTADRFGGVVLTYVADTLDRFYGDIRKSLEAIRARLDTDGYSTEELKIEILSEFNQRLFHTRTLVDYRLRCFPAISIEKVRSIFENIEDEFTLAVESLKLDEKHPEVLTAAIASGSAQIITILLQYEARLSGLDHSNKSRSVQRFSFLRNLRK